MRIVRGFAPPESLSGAAVAIGNFDGVHRGHQAVIARAADAARALSAPLGVVTFEPHPRRLFRPDDPPFRLTPLRPKAHALAALGVEILYVAPFSRRLAAVEAEDFIQNLLVGGLGARHVAVGEDFRFGRARRGDVAMLKALGAANGFGVAAVAPQGEGGETFSSSAARDALRRGDVDAARRTLGRSWEIEGRVQHGDKRGRLIGFPTANVPLGPYLRPAFGVYAVRVAVEGASAWRDGVANIGRRPTVGGVDERLEVHLFDFDGDLYGRHLRVALEAFLRPERRFDGLEALTAQIAADARAARETLGGQRV